MNENELYHYGVPGMRWGVRKAKIQAKADSYRDAASNAKTNKAAAYYEKKANKLDDKAMALDTAKGKVAYSIKKGAVITAGVLGVIGAVKVATIVGQHQYRNGVAKIAKDMDFTDKAWKDLRYKYIMGDV